MAQDREQIIKALECCFIICYCNTCPYYKVGEHTQVCTRKMAKDVLALIRELTEENERLHTSCTELTQCCTNLETLYKIECKRADATKADTVRRMQERLKEAIAYIEYRANIKRKTVAVETLLEQVDWVLHEVVPQRIDQIAKELLEETK